MWGWSKGGRWSLLTQVIQSKLIYKISTTYPFFCKISVESQFPPSAVNDAIENCIEDLEQYLLSLNHSDFKIHVSALRSAKVMFLLGFEPNTFS